MKGIRKTFFLVFFLVINFSSLLYAQPTLYKVLLYYGTELYEKPVFNSPSLKHLAYGEVVTVLSKDGNWALAQVGEKEGYIFLKYFKEVRPVYKPNYVSSSRGTYPSSDSIWTNSAERQTHTNTYVYICVSPYAYAYHRSLYCRGLNRCTHTIKKVTVKQARAKGYRPCNICY